MCVVDESIARLAGAGPSTIQACERALIERDCPIQPCAIFNGAIEPVARPEESCRWYEQPPCRNPTPAECEVCQDERGNQRSQAKVAKSDMAGDGF
jgi:hypothetical protein